MNLKSTFSIYFKGVLLLLCCLLGSSLYAQDKIHKKGGEVLEVKILEVSPDEIKYKLFSDPDGPIFIIDKDRILKVVYASGRSETYQNTLDDSELYIGQKNQNLKLNFLSPLLGYTHLSYERHLRPGRSMEFSLGIIGLGKKQYIEDWGEDKLIEKQAGAFASFGYKFIRLPDFKTRNQKYTHVMQGAYIKPEVMLGHFGRNAYDDSNIKTREKITFGGVLINLGKQWVYSDLFVLDIYGGIGYSFSDERDDDEDYFNYNRGRYYGMLSTGDDSSIGFSGGIRVGFMIK